jgi:alpha-glucosidase
MNKAHIINCQSSFKLNDKAASIHGIKPYSSSKRLCFSFGCWSLLILFLCLHSAYAQEYTVTSPNELLKMTINVSSDIKYNVSYNAIPLITPSAISIALNTGVTIGKNGTIKSTDTRTVNETITPLFGKNKEVENHFNELTILFNEKYSLIVRAYNEGVAYRFQTTMDGSLIVNSEEANFNFAGTPSVIFPEADATMYSWERSYTNYTSLQDIDVNKFSITPTMFSYPDNGIRVVIAESDLSDYPGMYLQRNQESGMKGKWAQYPKTVSDPDNVYAYHRVTERQNYLARTAGTRTYPWRVVMVSAVDKDWLNNQLIYKLARPQVLTNTDWIKPGKSTWEWWHDAILEGVDIPSGTTNLGYPLYKYYVDFAAENKIEYLTMDAGWGTGYVAQVCQYAASKNVKVFLWDFINLPVTNPDRLTELKNYGAAGVKVDLIERDDQVAINWFEQLAKDCADRGLMIIFHGCSKPTGLQRTYPNIVNYEAVRGAECDKWDNTPNPDYHMQFPFIRMLAGPLDYTPGSMRNVHLAQFTPIGKGIPMTIGTRVHEMAMYVLFDQPLGYMCDSPPEYRKYPDILSFFSHVPTTWDLTVPLAAKVGEYAVIAKKKGEEWYAAAMTNETGRELDIDFSFLPAGVTYNAQVFRDNDQTDLNAKAYTYEIITVTSLTKIKYRLAAGGGVAIRLYGQATGIKETEDKSKLMVYPNADHSKLTIQTSENIKAVSIFDITGKIRYQQTVSKAQSRHEVTISMLRPGAYIVKVETSSNTYSSKFII